MTQPFKLRTATASDLDALNRVIEAAVMTWQLPERIKRLSLPSYRYTEVDLAHLQIVVSVDVKGQILGVVSWEPADKRDCPPGKTGLLLYGLYVDPAAQGKGIGSTLLDAAITAARNANADGLLVKAQADAVDFFARRGLQALPIEDQTRHYSNRMWKTMPVEKAANN